MKASLLLGLGLLLSPNLWAAGDTLADAVENRESFRIQALLSRDIDVDQAQVDGMTALHWAVYHDDVELAKILLQRGAKAAVENRYGVTPLYLACLNGNPRLVEELLRAGADPNTARAGGETALMTAARTGVAGAVEP